MSDTDHALPALVARLETLLARPVYFREILDEAADLPYRTVLLAWSEIRVRHALERDELGRYFLPEI